jgi:pyrophosphate--fructose-6-phosphate 1-phosphotransferase
LAAHGNEYKDLDIDSQRQYIINHLSKDNAATFETLPEGVAHQLSLERDPHGNVQVSLIETDRLLSEMCANKLAEWAKDGKYVGKFAALHHFFGYEGRCAAPSNYDADYCYSLGVSAAQLIANDKTGYMAIVKNTTAPSDEWIAGGVPITMMMNMEKRNGEFKPVIRKALVDLNGKPFKKFVQVRDKFAKDTCFVYPGPIQYWGPSSVCDRPTMTLALEHE